MEKKRVTARFCARVAVRLVWVIDRGAPERFRVRVARLLQQLDMASAGVLTRFLALLFLSFIFIFRLLRVARCICRGQLLLLPALSGLISPQRRIISVYFYINRREKEK